MVNLAYSRAETLLKENQESLRKVRISIIGLKSVLIVFLYLYILQLAKALLVKEVLNYKDLVKLLGPMPYQKEHHHYKDLSNIW